MILVTGASGNVGGAVLSAVLERKAPVRALYRSEKDAAKAPVGAEAVLGDFADGASLDRALAGVESVYLVCSPIPQLVELETNVIEACRRAGVRHVVLNSALGAGEFDRSFPVWHFAVEQRLQGSGIPWTILRPESFMQNIVMFYAGTIRSEGAFYAAERDARLAFIDIHDIAAVAATALTTKGHEGAVYTLTGPEALTLAQVAERVSRVAGRTVRYVDLPPAQLKEAMLGMGMPEWQAQALVDLQAFYTEGPGGRVTDDVRRVEGREPTGLDQFLQENAGAFGTETHA